MVHHVFFVFKYKPDVWRANSIRNQNNVLSSQDTGFWDGSINENSFATNSEYIKRKIREGLEGTTVTIIIITSHTRESAYVKYEYDKSVEFGNGILLLHCEYMESRDGTQESRGDLPYAIKGLEKTWYHNCPLNNWIDEAYKNR